ncbi:MAG: hypothetical protein IKS63_05040 [Firmicutes bacterium]|nr:hypothetical protein [Bacillota bacterium]
MKREFFTVVYNREVARQTYEMVMQGDTSDITAPGQFINIRLKDLYLRRPISISSYKDGELTIIYKIQGIGTKNMSELPSGEVLDILVSSGNGFDVSKAHGKVAVVGGGCGVAPMYGVAEALVREQGITPTVLPFA